MPAAEDLTDRARDLELTLLEKVLSQIVSGIQRAGVEPFWCQSKRNFCQLYQKKDSS